MKLYHATWSRRELEARTGRPEQIGGIRYMKVIDGRTTGVEAANCYEEGRARERSRRTLVSLQPGESRHYHLSIQFEAQETSIQ